VDQDGSWSIVDDAGWFAGFLDAVLVVPARLTARGQVRCRRGRSLLRVMSAWMVGMASAQSSGGNVRRPGGGTADDAQGSGETCAVGVDVGGFGRLGDERGDRVVDSEPRPIFLVDQVGQA
jgi:hypothetical protein